MNFRGVLTNEMDAVKNMSSVETSKHFMKWKSIINYLVGVLQNLGNWDEGNGKIRKSKI